MIPHKVSAKIIISNEDEIVLVQVFQLKYNILRNFNINVFLNILHQHYGVLITWHTGEPHWCTCRVIFHGLDTFGYIYCHHNLPRECQTNMRYMYVPTDTNESPSKLFMVYLSTGARAVLKSVH